MEQKKTTKNIVVFHHDDPDGFGGAWAAWKKLKDKADYIPLSNDRDVLERLNLQNKEIYIIDYSFKPEEMRKLVETNKKVVLIDHHLTSAESAKVATESLYDIARSGASLSWTYFYPEKMMPRLLRHIEDFDIWKFKIKFTKEIIVALATYEYNFKTWSKIARDLENYKKRKEYIKDGKAILRYQEFLIKSIISSGGEEADFEGHKAFAVNSPVLESEIGHHIYDKKGMLAIVWSYKVKRGKPKLKVSLRSDLSIDVSQIALKYGGGGHKGAAGFTVEEKINFPWQTK